MSGTTLPTPLPTDKLLTPQSIIGYSCVAVGASAIAAAFVVGDAAMRGQALIAAVGAMAAAYGFYLGSSKGSADKTTIAPVVPAPTQGPVT